MATIVTRSGKGTPLTNNEVDANFNNLNTDKAELSGAVFTGAITTNSTIDGRDVAADGVTADAALPKAGGAMTGAITTNSTFDGVDIATRDGVLSTTTTTANAALPKAGGAVTGAITTNSTIDGRDVAADGVTADAALPRTGGAMTGAITTNSTFDGRDVAADGVTADAALPKSGGAMTGAITTNSTFDGRDVAADGVTADAALPKSGGAMTGAITTNSTFDGVDVGTRDAVLTSTTTTANAALPKAGGTMTGALIVNETTAVTMSAGTTAQRPTGVAGMFRYNTTEDKFEGYSTTWGEIGGGAADLRVNSFTGNGSTTAYTLTTSPDLSNTLAYIDGVYQVKAAYAMSNQVLTFTAAPDNGALIEITAATVAPVQESTDFLLNQYTGNGSTTAYTLSAAPTNENQCSVFISGVYQSKANFSVSGSTLTFSTAPPNGSAIEVMCARTVVFSAGTPDDNTVSTVKIQDDAVTSAKVDGTVATVAGNETLTNKTLTAPTINGGTHTAFTSTGIDDNANSTALTIDVNKNAGLGIAAPTLAAGWTRVLHSQAAGSGSSIRLADSTSGTSGDVGLLMGQYSNSSYFINRDNANMYFWTGGAERVRVDSGGRAIIGGGITLGNGQTYAAANTLDDYEEANWSPVVKSGTTVIATNVGMAKYTKIGNIVYVTAYVTRADSASLSGIIHIYGLPFPVLSGSTQLDGSNWFDTTGTDEVAANYFVAGSSYILCKKVGASSDYVTADKFQNTRPIYLAGTYMTS
jgi:hypothetical protein